MTSILALGLLAERPMTAYEIVKRVHAPGSITLVYWRASERTWYKEPQRLVDAGLAAHDAGEPRRYRITDAGRQALSTLDIDRDTRWAYRYEQIALLLATASNGRGSSIDRLAAIDDHIRRDAADLRDRFRALAAAGPDMPQRAPIAALAAEHFVSTIELHHQWATAAQRKLTELDDETPEEFAQALWSELADRLDVIAEHDRT